MKREETSDSLWAASPALALREGTKWDGVDFPGGTAGEGSGFVLAAAQVAAVRQVRLLEGNVHMLPKKKKELKKHRSVSKGSMRVRGAGGDLDVPVPRPDGHCSWDVG